jgi:hypothetical protein
MAATARSPPERATALLTPEAAPAHSAGTAPSAVDVTGATISASPSPKTTTAGKTSVRKEASGPTLVIRIIATPTMIGPTVSGNRAPILVASSPIRADSNNKMSVTGSSAVPAASGDQPEVTWSCTLSRKNNTPIPP